ncbi:sodium- and chloride-dependent GABA transporter 1-like [Hermetia illucens]|nr:sodium- and chloride-dependent GABA transporter 1-like [Hermetia illucens]
MAVAENLVNSYDAGEAPFKHDKNRSTWISTNDFALAFIGHSFGLRNFYTFATYLKMDGSIIMLLPYTATLILCVIPIFFIQSFMGQFSSTGYISAFRVSPILKGVGYVITILNFTSLTYYSSVASYPLLLLLRTFTWELPWMSCRNSWNTPNCTQPANHTFDHISRFLLTSPSKEFFDKEVIKMSSRINTFQISWPMVGALFVIWLLTAGCLMNGIVTIGRVLRYATITALTFLVILFIRMLFLPNSMAYFLKFITPSMEAVRSPDAWLVSPVLGALTLGTGWGSIMTLASYNQFKADAEKYSIAIPCIMSLIVVFSGILVHFVGEYLKERNIFNIQVYNEFMYEFFWIGLPYFVGTLEAAQLWFALTYTMLFLCEFSSIVIQTLSITTALFDEYAKLRPFKKHITIGLCSTLFALSSFFATNLGIKLYGPLTFSAAFAQMAIVLIEIIMIVWIYGRKRFQQDFKFMLGRPFPTWKFSIIRFVTPIIVVFMGFIYFIVTFVRLHAFPLGILLTFLIKILPWVIIPAYALYKISTTTGTVKERFRKCFQPNDWYPADPRDRQRYNEMLGSSEVSHQLVEMDNHENHE